MDHIRPGITSEKFHITDADLGARSERLFLHLLQLRVSFRELQGRGRIVYRVDASGYCTKLTTFERLLIRQTLHFTDPEFPPLLFLLYICLDLK